MIANVQMPDAQRHRPGPAAARRPRDPGRVGDPDVAHAPDEHETIAGLEAGADDFLVKPFSGRELLVRVQTRLELTAMRRRNAQQEEVLASLQRTLSARDEFLSAASHELRTPITTLSLQTDGLLTSYGTGNGRRARHRRADAAAAAEGRSAGRSCG